jgi:hypothetical protein
MRFLCLVAAALLSVCAASPASAAVQLLDSFTNAVTPDGVFGGAATRSSVGWSGSTSFITVAGTANLTADDAQAPTNAGLVYDFTPHQPALSKVSLTARNRQSSPTETGDLRVRVTTGAGVFVVSQTIAPTAGLQALDFDFTSQIGPGMVVQRVEVLWDLPSGGTGLRGLTIGQIDLYEVPEPATIALIGLASSCGGVVGYRRRKKAVAKKD